MCPDIELTLYIFSTITRIVYAYPQFRTSAWLQLLVFLFDCNQLWVRFNYSIYLSEWLKKREKALKENNKELLYESCKKLAEIYKEDGKYEASLIYFKRAQDVCERTVDIAVLNRWIGEVYCDMEMFDEAIDYQKKHLGMFPLVELRLLRDDK